MWGFRDRRRRFVVSASELWELIVQLEAQLPLSQDRIGAAFGATFEATRDHNKDVVLVAKTPRFELGLRPATDTFDGQLTIALSGTTIESKVLAEHFPDGHSVPPPPPGYGPADAQGIYIANRPWGQIWFAMYRGDRIAHLTIRPGVHGSPGI